MKMLDWRKVDSSVLSAIAYDPDAAAIYVHFTRSGDRWRYAECSLAEWHEFSSPSTSKGKYLNEILKHKPATQVR